MKTLYLLTFTLVAIIIGSCYSIESDCAADDFFPLRVGDKFLYRLSPESEFELAPWADPIKEEVEVKVTRKIDTLGQTYCVIENYFGIIDYFDIVNGSEVGIIYARMDGNNVYFFAPNQEVLYYRFDPSDDKEYWVPLGTSSYGWSIMIDGSYVIKKFYSDKNHFTFLIKDNLPPFVGPPYRNYLKFERCKGLTQSIIEAYDHRLIYNLVKVYR
jgi:hypothetical protein